MNNLTINETYGYASLLFYMGLLTMTNKTFAGSVSLTIPNEVMNIIFAKLFLSVMNINLV